MTLDDQLRTLVDQVPTSPTSDPVELYARGRRRRRTRRAAGAGSALVLVAALAVGLSQLDGAGLRPEVIDAPTIAPEDGEAPVVVDEAATVVIGAQPFPYSLGLAPGTDGRWCVVGIGSPGPIPSPIDQPCDQVLLPDRTSDPERLVPAGVRSLALPHQQASSYLLYGFAPTGTEEVVLRMSDGTRAQGAIAIHPLQDNILFAVGWVDTVGVDPVEVEARGSYGEVIEPVEPLPATPRPLPRDVEDDEEIEPLQAEDALMALANGPPTQLPPGRSVVDAGTDLVTLAEDGDTIFAASEDANGEICLHILHQIDSESDRHSTSSCAAAASVEHKGLGLRVSGLGIDGTLEAYLVADGFEDPQVPGLTSAGGTGNVWLLDRSRADVAGQRFDGLWVFP